MDYYLSKIFGLNKKEVQQEQLEYEYVKDSKIKQKGKMLVPEQQGIIKIIEAYQSENNKPSKEAKIQEQIKMCIYSFVLYCARNKSKYKILKEALKLQKVDQNYNEYSKIIEQYEKIEQIEILVFLNQEFQSKDKYYQVLYNILLNYAFQQKYNEIQNENQLIQFMATYFEINLQVNDQIRLQNINQQIDFIFLEEKYYFYLFMFSENEESQIENKIQFKKGDKVEIIFAPDEVSAKCVFVLFQLFKYVEFIKTEDNVSGEYQIIDSAKINITLEQMIQSFLYDIIKQIILEDRELLKLDKGINKSLSTQKLNNIVQKIQENKKFLNYKNQNLNIKFLSSNISACCEINFKSNNKYELLCYQNYLKEQSQNSQYCQKCYYSFVEVFYQDYQLCQNCLQKKLFSYI
ncbi:hypothetical protein ABPG74_016558 [Tetrahymena malaccensis]